MLTHAGKTVKCADVDADLKGRFADSYKTCVDKEVLQGSSGSSSGAGSPASSPVWIQMDGMDVSGKDIPAGGKAFTEVCMAETQGSKQA